MHILLVEDSEDDASLLTQFLAHEKDAPHVHWVTDGQEALDYVFREGRYSDAERPDVIVLDLALHRMGGYETLQRIKYSDHADIPIIVLTTSQNPMDGRSCLKLGASAFFSKPNSLQGYEKLVCQLVQFEFPRLMSTQDKPH